MTVLTGRAFDMAVDDVPSAGDCAEPEKALEVAKLRNEIRELVPVCSAGAGKARRSISGM